MLAPARHAATGRIGLRATPGGFGTPVFGDGRELRIEDGALVVDGGRPIRITTLRAAARAAGLAEPRAVVDVYTPTTGRDPDEDIGADVDPAAASALGSWYGYCASLLDQIRADATEPEAPSLVQLWPEHFDMSVDLGVEGKRANYGGSPGDDAHPEPYLYVGPWDMSAVDREDDYWNEPFGASLRYAELLAGADGLAFLRRGKSLIT